jgi:hypothetical protein
MKTFFNIGLILVEVKSYITSKNNILLVKIFKYMIEFMTNILVIKDQNDL